MPLRFGIGDIGKNISMVFEYGIFITTYVISKLVYLIYFDAIQAQ